MFSPRLIHHYLKQAAECKPDKEAIIINNNKITYKQLDELSDRLAAYLINIGIKRQDRIAILLENSCEAVISLYAALKAGCVFVLLNSNLKPLKISYILSDSGASALITHSDKSNIIIESLNQLKNKPHLIFIGDPENSDLFDYQTWSTAVNENMIVLPWNPPSSHHIIDVDLASLIYTSGSTGDPKGVISTHYNMVSAAQSIISYIGNYESDRILNVLPLSFDYGLYQIIMSVMYKGTVILEENFIYPHLVFKKIQESKITGFPIVPTIMTMLLNMKDLTTYDFSTLRYISNTGAALPIEHIRKFRQLYPDIKVISMFGLTECKRVAYMPPEQLDSKPSSVGKPIPNCDVSLVDENGKEVENGNIGQLVIRGSNVMQGYWNSPELTSRTFRIGRYPGEILLFSGDYFRQDEEGFLYFLGRIDDMIKCRGERVSPKEVENCLCMYRDISEAAVIGIPDLVLGQAVKAFVVLKNGTQKDEKAILRHCFKYMESYAIPKVIEFVDCLPKTPNGKIDKKSLAKEGELQ